MSDKKEVDVWFPEESYCTVETRTKEGKPVVIVIQDSLKKFVFKDVFGWNLSIVFFLNDVGDEGMPSGNEIGIVQDYCESLERSLNVCPEKPNALFLFRETYDGVCHVVWRVHDAVAADAILQKVIEENRQPREFEYEMVYDEGWELVEWYIT
ncbi:MAG: DUF695 domain-containing protein [Bacteroidales bacterium]|nr:DUF695 domain-containing protein [Bacteroidales bacterium]